MRRLRSGPTAALLVLAVTAIALAGAVTVRVVLDDGDEGRPPRAAPPPTAGAAPGAGRIIPRPDEAREPASPDEPGGAWQLVALALVAGGIGTIAVLGVVDARRKQRAGSATRE